MANNYDKMRESLEESRDALDTIMSTSCHNLREITASRAYRKCREALALPRRNCDVGSSKEQNSRYEHYCFTHRTMERCCQGCPIKDEPCCELAWAQLPYEREGEGDGSK